MGTSQFPELGFYALPGHVNDPKRIYHELAKAEELGLGSVWLSERLNTKEIGVVSGIAAARTERMGIVASFPVNLPLRSPLVIAGLASTMATVSDNRFALGIARGFDRFAQMSGTPPISFRVMEDYIDIMRRLWRGEVINYQGPAGSFQGAALGMKMENPPPVIVAAMGRKTAYWAGKVADAVLLNSLWSSRAVEEYIKLVRQGARDAGRDPASVKIWATLVTACEVPEAVMLETVIRRINTYVLFPTFFNLLCDANGWDKNVAARARSVLAEIDGAPAAGSAGDEHTSRDLDDLRRMKAVYPEHWLREGCAIGSAAECAAMMKERFDAGADGILFHGTSPDDVAPLLDAWRKIRPAVRFEQRSSNPGL